MIIVADTWIAHPVGIVIIPPVLVLHVQLLPHMQPSLFARPRHCVVQYEGDDQRDSRSCAEDGIEDICIFAFPLDHAHIYA